MTGDNECADSPQARSTRNHAQGDFETVVQAGAIHGDVYLSAASTGQGPVPRQLPLAISGFVNRTAELAGLDALMSSEDVPVRHSKGVVVIAAIGGAPGIGKTALALQWAHRARAHFVDGDLYVNMHGHGPGPRLDTSKALDSLLRALDVAPERIPDDLDSRAALYRSRLNGKRVLVLIDDAVSAEQIRPLLPASPTCLVLVTSRSTLGGLVVREGAQRVPLETLTTRESLNLLRIHVGRQRVNAEPDAALSLVTHCARLPLALRILAERLIDRPASTLHDVAAELDAESERLDALTTDDALSDARTVFASSYTALSTEVARMFRILGVHPGTELDPASCAAASNMSVKQARALLDQLVQAHLLQRLGHDRFRLHDLLRLYAAERFHAEEPAQREAELVDRIAHWYLASARHAVSVVFPNFRTVEFPDVPPEPPVFTTTDAAMAWFDQHRRTLLCTLRAATDHNLNDVAWRLPATVYGFFVRRHHWHEWRELHLIGYGAARVLGHGQGQARNLLGLADAEALLNDVEQAEQHYSAALEAAREVGDNWTQGFALRQLGELRWEQSHSSEAMALLGQAIEEFRAAGERRGEGMVLLSLAECERRLGNHDRELQHCTAATAVFTDIADTWSVAWAQRYRAEALGAAGRLHAAVREYQSALPVFIELADIDTEAITRIGLGRAHGMLGEIDQARVQLGTALDLLRSVHDPRAEDIESELANLT